MNVVLLICGCIGLYAALFGPSKLVRDCPFCKGAVGGCARCDWSGEIDDREVR
ncbi:hypothetical protein ACIBG0_38765 [Nocardia sp. NPDC050630]|uniref:hypothetical protein n=1 Tax=Nocardia sp. NPDC050630 TaxID=3364321 RepID=UPI003797CE98